METQERPIVQVTPREWEVVCAFVKDGADNETIGKRLGITQDTVKSHVKSLMKKTGHVSRTALALAIVRRHVDLRVVDRNGERKK